MANLSQKYINYFKKLISSIIIVTDLHNIVSSNNSLLIGKDVDEDVVSIVEKRQIIYGNSLHIDRTYKYYYLVPIINDGNLLGSVMCLFDNEINEEDKVVANIISILLKELIC